jgi:uncharacterized protein (TIGR02001 family)
MTAYRLLACQGLAALSLLSAPILAHAEEGEGLSADYEVGVVSDYRYRGYSLSDEKPALQAGATVNIPGGWYAGTWGSTIAEYGVGADGDGAHVEVDLFAGKAFSLGAFDVDVAVQAYLYPGGSDVNFAEIPVKVSRTVGPWTATLQAVYTPRQDVTVPEANRYVSGGLVWQAPERPWQVSARVGYEDGAFAPDGKIDWELGVARSFGPVSVGLSYVDTDDDSIEAGLVASVKAGF